MFSLFLMIDSIIMLASIAVMNKKKAWAAESRKLFLHFGYTLYTQNKEKHHYMSQFANLNLNHLISFKVLRAQPKADGDVAVMF